jgi:plastocyanin
MRSFAQRTLDIVDECIANTLKLHDVELNSLIRTANILDSFFQVESHEDRSHRKKIRTHIQDIIKEIGKKHQGIITLANMQNPIMHVYFDIWTELGTAIRDLMSGNYMSSYRSLRWMIDSIAFWIYIQNKNVDIIDHINLIYNDDADFGEMSLKCKIFNAYKERVNIIEERFRLKELLRGPDFSTLVNSLAAFKRCKNSEIIDKIIDKIISDMGSLWKEFYQFSHPTSQSQKMIGKVFDDYVFFIKYRYDDVKFYTLFERIWHVIDLTATIFMLTNSSFYRYESVEDYFKTMKQFYPQQSPIRKILNFGNTEVKSKLPTLFSLLIPEKTIEITIGKQRIFPVEIHTQPGQSLTWKSEELVLHRILSGQGPTDPSRGAIMDSKPFSRSFSFKSMQVSSFPYFCEYHSSETGSIVTHKKKKK